MRETDPASARRRMVERQLRRRGITDERVLVAMGSVPREEFVPGWQRDRAYLDQPLEIGDGQTISQPFVVAATLEHARIGPEDRLLDVGTGSGYAAAVASLVCAQVFTVERIARLATIAERRLLRLGHGTVRCLVGDGSEGWAAHAPFDVIVSGAASPTVPRCWKEQLRDGGRIVAPIGPRWGQTLIRETRSGDRFEREALMEVRYVPLIGRHGYPGTPDA